MYVYHDRVSEEVRKSIMRLLPGVEVEVGGHYDSNSYLLNQHWGDIGAQISKNVFELLSAPDMIRSAKTQKSLADSKRLAAHMAILTQVHLAHEQLATAQKQYDWAQELDQLNRQIQTHVANSAANEALSPLERIRTDVDAVLSHLQRQQAYADVQAAAGKMYVSLGLDPLPEAVEADDVNSLAQAIETVDKDWREGIFPRPLPEPETEGEAPAGSESATETSSAATVPTPPHNGPLFDLMDAIAGVF